MKQFSLTGATTVFLMSTGLSGYASDVSSSMAALPRMPLYNWTGFYVGANLGGAWASDRLNDSFTGASAGLSTGGFIGGGQLGYNFQAGNFVFGAEWVLDGGPLNTSGSLESSLVASANTSWVTTLAARFGWAFDKYLWFGKAGGDWGKDRATLANVRNGAQVNASNTNTGWLWGTGIEYAFARPRARPGSVIVQKNETPKATRVHGRQGSTLAKSANWGRRYELHPCGETR